MEKGIWTHAIVYARTSWNPGGQTGTRVRIAPPLNLQLWWYLYPVGEAKRLPGPRVREAEGRGQEDLEHYGSGLVFYANEVKQQTSDSAHELQWPLVPQLGPLKHDKYMPSIIPIWYICMYICMYTWSLDPACYLLHRSCLLGVKESLLALPGLLCPDHHLGPSPAGLLGADPVVLASSSAPNASLTLAMLTLSFILLPKGKERKRTVSKL